MAINLRSAVPVDVPVKLAVNGDPQGARFPVLAPSSTKVLDECARTLSAVGPPHFFAMSACAARAMPGTVQRTRFSQFRALLPVSPKSGAAVREGHTGRRISWPCRTRGERRWPTRSLTPASTSRPSAPPKCPAAGRSGYWSMTRSGPGARSARPSTGHRGAGVRVAAPEQAGCARPRRHPAGKGANQRPIDLRHHGGPWLRRGRPDRGRQPQQGAQSAGLLSPLAHVPQKGRSLSPFTPGRPPAPPAARSCPAGRGGNPTRPAARSQAVGSPWPRRILI